MTSSLCLTCRTINGHDDGCERARRLKIAGAIAMGEPRITPAMVKRLKQRIGAMLWRTEQKWERTAALQVIDAWAARENRQSKP